MYNRRKPMGDHQRRAPLRNAFERRLDLAFRKRVERRCRFVEHEDWRALEDRARDCDALLLAARQLQPALADLRSISLRQRADEFVDLGVLGGRSYFRLARAVAAIADIIGDRIVEQHRILRHHADGFAQRSLRDLADILAIDGDAARRGFIEAEQQPRDRRFAGARGSDDGDCLARRRLERNAAQDLALGIVVELDVFEADIALRDDKRLGAWNVLNLGVLLENIEHQFDIDDRLLDVAIDHPHEVQRLIKLQHHQVEQREIADAVAAAANALHAHHDDDDEADGENYRLPRVEHGERSIGAHAQALVALHRLVVAQRFSLLGAKVLDGFEVQQAVDSLGVGVGIALVHRAANADAPVGGERRVNKIDGDHHDNCDGVAPVERDEERREDQREFDRRGHGDEHRRADDGFDGVAAALENAGQSAGLALKMKAQRQLMQMHEHFDRQAAHGVHRDLGEQRVAPLREHRHQDPHEAVDHRQCDHARQYCRQRNMLRGRVANQRIGRPFECIGHANRHEFGGEHQDDRHQDAQF